MGYNKKKINVIGNIKEIIMPKEKTLKIAICDDEKRVCAEIEAMLERIAQQFNIRVEISVWFSGETIRDYINKGNSFNIIFLDIELMKLTGIDVCKFRLI